MFPHSCNKLAIVSNIRLMTTMWDIVERCERQARSCSWTYRTTHTLTTACPRQRTSLEFLIGGIQPVYGIRDLAL